VALDWKKSSGWWYGRFAQDGRTKLINLGVKIQGKRPQSINGEGDAAFERSRVRARAKHDELLADLQSKRNLRNLTERLIELKTGDPAESIKLSDLPKAWAEIPRRRQPSARYASQCQATLKHLVAFLEAKGVEDLDSVTARQIAAFLEFEADRGISGKRWNDILKLVRGLFRHLAPHAPAYLRYLVNATTRDPETIFRRPFTAEELAAILEAARDDDFMRPLIIAGACTALRKADCCFLRWDDVDLEAGFITIKTEKTPEKVAIPIFPLLADELRRHVGNESQYCFPAQAEMQRANPDGITWRFKRILTKALGEDTTVPRANGKRRASVLDFHSLRTSWITAALAAGVPIEITKKVTGHKTVDIVQRHYFRPGRNALKVLEERMPRILMSGGKTRDEELKSIIERMAPADLRARALAILESHTGQ
jgi:integrase